jgi:hypothetical protein
MASNRYQVSKRQWTKWSGEAQIVFNETYSALRHQDVHNASPATKRLPKVAWDCIRWNAAFIAACEINRIDRARPAKAA